MVYVDDVNILGGSVHTVKENTEVLIVSVFISKEIGLAVNDEKTKYIAMSRDQNARQNRNIRRDNKSTEMMEQFKYLGTNLKDQNSIQEEIKNSLKSVNACCHSVQNLLSFSLLPKNIKIKIYRTVILPVVLYGCETWSLTLTEIRRLRVCENRGLRRIHRVRKRLYPFFIFFSRCPMCGEWCKLH